MTNKAPLSTFFTHLSSRVSQIRTDIRLIERERIMLDPHKIVPLHDYAFAFISPFVFGHKKQTYLQTAYMQTQKKILTKMINQSAKGQINFYVSSCDILTQESYEMHKVMNEMGAKIADIASVDTSVFFHLGDLLNTTERVLADKGLWCNTRLSAALGGGKTDLEIWKSLNAIHDYTDNFPDDKPTRRRKKREFKPGVLKWTPKLN